MARRSVLTMLICLALVGTLATLRDHRTVAQEEGTPVATETPPPTPTPIPTPTAYPFRALAFNLLADMTMEVTTSGPSVVRAAAITIQPGQESLPFVNEGITVIAVTSGEIRVESNRASLQVVDASVLVGLTADLGTPRALSDETVPAGWQLVIAEGSTTVIRNDGPSPAALLVLALLPTTEGGSATGGP